MAGLLKDLDYSVVQQCMHCGMCLPSCPTYVATGRERHSPRGRISLMRAVADGDLEVKKAFGEEMYYCLGCLACTTACPAGVDYPRLFEAARAEIEEERVMDTPERRFWRWLALRAIFRFPRRLRAIGWMLRQVQRLGLDRLARRLKLTWFLPASLRRLESRAPRISPAFSDALIPERAPARVEPARHVVGLLTGCIQDLCYADINRDTAEVLQAAGCTVLTPRLQSCCGSLHAHNGDLETARELARRQMDAFPLEECDAIITNAAGCGSHLKHYAPLLADDPAYAAKARLWDQKARDIHEWLARIGFQMPEGAGGEPRVKGTYHEACHLCHGQKISGQPRSLLRQVPGMEWAELPQATVCCGSAGIYSITQPEQATALQVAKCEAIAATGATVLATANPGCHLQIAQGLAAMGRDDIRVAHPITLLAEALRQRSAKEAS